MGWGVLFSGYLFLLSIPLHEVGICVEILGYFLMARGLTLLEQYDRSFHWAKLIDFLMIPFGTYALFLQCATWFSMTELVEACNRVASLPVTVVFSALLLAFHMFLYSGVSSIAKEVDLPDIASQSVRNRVFSFFYFALTIGVSFCNTPRITEYVPYTSLVAIVSLVGIVWMLLTGKMLFNCYMWICLPGDEDMPADRKTFFNPFPKKKSAGPESSEDDSGGSGSRTNRKRHRSRKK